MTHSADRIYVGVASIDPDVVRTGHEQGYRQGLRHAVENMGRHVVMDSKTVVMDSETPYNRPSVSLFAACETEREKEIIAEGLAMFEAALRENPALRERFTRWGARPPMERAS